jgi:hypothetical protein
MLVIEINFKIILPFMLESEVVLITKTQCALFTQTDWLTLLQKSVVICYEREEIHKYDLNKISRF